MFTNDDQTAFLTVAVEKYILLISYLAEFLAFQNVRVQPKYAEIVTAKKQPVKQ